MITPFPQLLFDQCSQKKSEVKLLTCAPDQDLIATMAHLLEQMTPAAFPRTLLLVPTQRVGTGILGKLSEVFPIFPAPDIHTLAGWVHLHGNNSAEAPPKIWHDEVFELKIELLLQSASYRPLLPYHARELRLLWQQMLDANLNPTDFSSLAQWLVEHGTKSETEVHSLLHRVEVIQQVFHAVEELQEKEHSADSRRQFYRYAKNLRQEIDSLIEPYDHLFLVGYTSVAPRLEPLLAELAEATLCQGTSLTFLQHLPRQRLDPDAPYAQLLTLVRKLATEPEQAYDQARYKVHSSQKLRLTEVDHPHQEVETALSILQGLFATGVSPHETAILVPDEGRYGALLRHAASRLPHKNFALPLAFDATKVGQWVLSLFDFLTYPTSWDHTAPLWHDPFSFTLWFNEYPEEWGRWHIAWLQRCTAGDHKTPLYELQHLAASFPAAWQERALHFQEAVKTKEQTLSSWLELLRKLLEPLLATMDPAATAKTWEQLATDALHQALTAWTDQVSHIHGYFPSFQAWRILRGWCQRLTIQDRGEPYRGVQILSLPESRLLTFRHAIVIGCNEGSFPKAIPDDELLDETLKKKLGLPGWSGLEQMENLTFELLVQRCEHLHLIRSRLARGTESIASRHLEYLPPGFSLVALPPPKLRAVPDAHQLAPECGVRIAPEVAQKITEQLAASTVEKMLHCPTHFALHRSRLRRWELRPEHLWERQFGMWLHSILEQFVIGRTQMPALPHLKALTVDERSEAALIARLKRIAECVIPANFAGHYDVIHLNEFVIPRYVATFAQWLAELGLKTDSMRREWQADPRKPWFFARRLRRFAGRIDAIDEMTQGLVLIDFKRSYTPQKRDIINLLSPQLAVYAHLIWNQDEAKELGLVAGYWDMRRGVWEPRLTSFEQEASGLLQLQKCEKLQNNIDHLEETFAAIETEAIRTGFFPSVPFNCDPCKFKAQCRKGDQRLLEAFDQQLVAWPLTKAETAGARGTL